jgi:hypothetical protein
MIFTKLDYWINDGTSRYRNFIFAKKPESRLYFFLDSVFLFIYIYFDAFLGLAEIQSNFVFSRTEQSTQNQKSLFLGFTVH